MKMPQYAITQTSKHTLMEKFEKNWEDQLDSMSKSLRKMCETMQQRITEVLNNEMKLAKGIGEEATRAHKEESIKEVEETLRRWEAEMLVGVALMAN